MGEVDGKRQCKLSMHTCNVPCHAPAAMRALQIPRLLFLPLALARLVEAL